MKQALTLIATLLLSTAALADDDGVPRRRPSGLSVFAGTGVVWADDANANFYSGRPDDNKNSINLVLHSNNDGHRIWQNLVNDQKISPSAIQDENQLQVVEYPEMYYRTSFQLGLGVRYDYSNGFGWLLRFDIWRLRALGAFNISSTNGTGILSDNHQYIRCGMTGKEDRISIDLALTRTVDLGDNLCLEVDLGASINNTRVKENMMEIDGATYSILNIWGNRAPDVGVGSYEYVNQGGLGWGVFMSALVGYSIEGVGAIKAGYTCYHAKTNLEGYDLMGWHHSINIRFEINNFSFL